MLEQQVGTWLDELASAAPAPGGGAAAAMLAAVGAALVSMVCNLTIGKPRYAEHDELMRAALDRAGQLRAQAVRLGAEDEAAFSAVSAAYQLPRDTEEQKAERTEAIQVALVGAAGVPLRTAVVAAEIIRLADGILAGANVNVISDVAVAASAARAALDSAVVNVEINLAALRDPASRETLAAELSRHVAAGPVADQVVAAVRDRVNAAKGG